MQEMNMSVLMGVLENQGVGLEWEEVGLGGMEGEREGVRERDSCCMDLENISSFFLKGKVDPMLGFKH